MVEETLSCGMEVCCRVATCVVGRICVSCCRPVSIVPYTRMCVRVCAMPYLLYQVPELTV